VTGAVRHSTAALCRFYAAGLDDGTAVGARVLSWPGDPTADALPLRLAGGLHSLVLSGRASDLGLPATPARSGEALGRPCPAHCGAMPTA